MRLSNRVNCDTMIKKQRKEMENVINTVLFDLDGTIIHISQQAFIGAYLDLIGKKFDQMGIDAQLGIKAILAGRKEMVEGKEGKCTIDRFWPTFAKVTGVESEKLADIKASMDSFYSGEFNQIKQEVTPNDIPKRLVRNMSAKGYSFILSTNPLFPISAVRTRLSWIGLEPSDFLLITHCENFNHCKPNLEYYRQILAATGKTPEQCLMVGNDTVEDMCAGQLGLETFLVTDFVENQSGADISKFRNGTLAQLEAYLLSLPSLT